MNEDNEGGGGGRKYSLFMYYTDCETLEEAVRDEKNIEETPGIESLAKH